MARGSSTRFAILGMLSLGPMSGYDIKQFAESSIGHFWTENYGQIYPTLKELLAEGLITRRKGASDARKQVYEIAPRGREALRGWLRVPPAAQPVRSELMLKLFFGDQIEPAEAAVYVRESLKQFQDLLHEYVGIKQQLRRDFAEHPGLPYWLITLRFGEERAEGVVRWAKETLRELEQLESGHVKDKQGAAKQGQKVRK